MVLLVYGLVIPFLHESSNHFLFTSASNQYHTKFVITTTAIKILGTSGIKILKMDKI